MQLLNKKRTIFYQQIRQQQKISIISQMRKNLVNNQALILQFQQFIKSDHCQIKQVFIDNFQQLDLSFNKTIQQLFNRLDPINVNNIKFCTKFLQKFKQLPYFYNTQIEILRQQNQKLKKTINKQQDHILASQIIKFWGICLQNKLHTTQPQLLFMIDTFDQWWNRFQNLNNQFCVEFIQPISAINHPSIDKILQYVIPVLLKTIHNDKISSILCTVFQRQTNNSHILMTADFTQFILKSLNGNGTYIYRIFLKLLDMKQWYLIINEKLQQILNKLLIIATNQKLQTQLFAIIILSQMVDSNNNNLIIEKFFMEINYVHFLDKLNKLRAHNGGYQLLLKIIYTYQSQLLWDKILNQTDLVQRLIQHAYQHQNSCYFSALVKILHKRMQTHRLRIQLFQQVCSATKIVEVSQQTFDLLAQYQNRYEQQL